MKPTKKQQEKAIELLNFFESADDGYYEAGKRRFEVNVKRHSDHYDLDKAIKEKLEEANIKKQFVKEVERRLREQFTEEHIWGIINMWLEYECEFLHGIFESRGSHVFDKGSAELEYFRYVLPFGFAGRSGGHYLFDMIVNIHDIEDVAENYDAGHDGDLIKEILEDAERRKRDALWLKDYVDSYNKGLECQDELELRVEEAITDIMADIQRELDHKAKADLAKRIVKSHIRDAGQQETVLSFIK